MPLQSQGNADEAFMELAKESQPLEEGEKIAIPNMATSPSRQFSKQYSRQYSGESTTGHVAIKTKTDKEKVCLIIVD